MTHSKADVIGPFLLQPDVTRMVIGELYDQHALVLGQGGRDLLDELLLPLNVYGRKQLVLVDRLEQLFVFLFALILGVGKRRDVPQLSIELELGRALVRQLQEFV